jgi:hypothetical protein
VLILGGKGAAQVVHASEEGGDSSESRNFG